MNPDFGKWLDDMRIAAGMSQTELAVACEVAPPTISRIISGQRGVGIETIPALAKGLNVPVEIVMKAAGIITVPRARSLRSEQVLERFNQLADRDKAIVEALIYTMLRLDDLPNQDDDEERAYK